MVNTRLLKGKIAASGYTQRTLALEAKMGVNALNAKINGHRVFDTDEVIRLCSILGISDSQEKVQIFLSQSSHKWDDGRVT